MDNQNNYSKKDEQYSWFDCIGDIIDKHQSNQNSLSNIEKILDWEIQNQMNQQIFSTDSNTLQNQILYYKRGRSNIQFSDDGDNIEGDYLFHKKDQLILCQNHKNFICNQQKNCKKKQKQKRQHIYSKNYRERKKSQLKFLSQQNEILKKKIIELQYRLRQKQIEINRIKNPPPQVQLKVDELNQQFIKNFTFDMSQDQDSFVVQSQKIQKQKKLTKQEKIQKFSKNYDKYGFAGTDKIQSINYYFNEVIQCIFRDSQRYFCMLCYKNKDNQNIDKNIQTLTGYELLDSVFKQIFQINQQRSIRLRHYFKGLQPFLIDLKNSLNTLNSFFQKIIKSMQKIHCYIRILYPNDMVFKKKRIKLQQWFEQNKYSRILRKLRTDWFDLIKHDNPLQYNPEETTDVDDKKSFHQNNSDWSRGWGDLDPKIIHFVKENTNKITSGNKKKKIQKCFLVGI